MTRKQIFAAILPGLAVILSTAGPDPAKAQSMPSAALAGQVSSQEEGRMEGVVVSAKREGSTVTITVVSDAQGRYSFPRTKLEPGRYSLRIRAVGYDLNDPGPVEVTAQKTSEVDLKLRKTGDLAYQLTNAEWFLSAPGTEEQKKIFMDSCLTCHTVERIFRSRYNAAQFVQIQERMSTYHQATPLRPQRSATWAERGGPEAAARRRVQWAKRGEYFSTVNLASVSRWEYPLKTLPRPKGKATRVIITEFDLPRADAQPHDAAVDSQGRVWYADFGQQYLGRLDPKTSQVVEWPVPVLKPGATTGSKDVQLDRDGNVWIGMMMQAGIAKFDPKTEKFQTWRLSKELDSDIVQLGEVMPHFHHLDGKVWTSDWRLDLRTGEWEIFHPYRDLPPDSPAARRPHTTYGIAIDSRNNLYVLDIGSEYIGRVDAQTGKSTLYATPTFSSGPRRGQMDSQDRLWFAEYFGNKIAMFDTKTERFQEWAIPTPFSGPYDAVLDKAGYAWAGGMTTDRVARLNTKTGEVIEYLLPRSTNIRRVDVDNSTDPPTFWVGNNHGASIIKVEPLE